MLDAILWKMLVIKGAILFFINEYSNISQYIRTAVMLDIF